MRISDWSSDVCSSDLIAAGRVTRAEQHADETDDLLQRARRIQQRPQRADDDDAVNEVRARHQRRVQDRRHAADDLEAERKSVVEGKRVSVRVDLGARRIIKKKNKKKEDNKDTD